MKRRRFKPAPKRVLTPKALFSTRCSTLKRKRRPKQRQWHPNRRRTRQRKQVIQIHCQTSVKFEIHSPNPTKHSCRKVWGQAKWPWEVCLQSNRQSAPQARTNSLTLIEALKKTRKAASPRPPTRSRKLPARRMKLISKLRNSRPGIASANRVRSKGRKRKLKCCTANKHSRHMT